MVLIWIKLLLLKHLI